MERHFQSLLLHQWISLRAATTCFDEFPELNRAPAELRSKKTVGSEKRRLDSILGGNGQGGTITNYLTMIARRIIEQPNPAVVTALPKPEKDPVVG